MILVQGLHAVNFSIFEFSRLTQTRPGFICRFMQNKITAHEFSIVQYAAAWLLARGYDVAVFGTRGYAMTNAPQHMIESALFVACYR